MAKRGKYYKVSKFSFTGLDAQHYRTTEQYTRAVETLFERAAADVAHNTANINPGEKEFTFDDYPSAKKHMEKVAGQLAGKVTATIERGSRKEWLFACAKNDEFLESIMETSKVKKATLKKMQDRNLDALETFQGRKVGGMNLSQRVWKYVDEWKDHLEMALDVGLGDGVSAAKLARDVRQDLKDPNRLFRRVRDKHGNLVLSKHARAFHPGQGVYRSSVKNAQRLTRSEINMAYRESDFKRWQQLDFVVGFEIVRSNHEPHFECPLCDRLAGKYPKTFKFVGWHPQCMCKAIPILMDDETFDANELGELRAALRGTEYKALQGKNAVTEMPDGFMEWVQENAERQANWNSTPYFIRDNFMNGNLKDGLKIKMPAVEESGKIDYHVPFERLSLQERDVWLRFVNNMYPVDYDWRYACELYGVDIKDWTAKLEKAVENNEYWREPELRAEQKQLNAKLLAAIADVKKQAEYILEEFANAVNVAKIWIADNGTDTLELAKASFKQTEKEDYPNYKFILNAQRKKLNVTNLLSEVDKSKQAYNDAVSQAKTIISSSNEQETEALRLILSDKPTEKYPAELLTADILAEIRNIKHKKSAIQDVRTESQHKNEQDFCREYGIIQGEDMTFEEANELRGNPNYAPKYIHDDNGNYRDRKTGERFSKNPEYKRRYTINCQSCVVANELRRRGMDVAAKGNTDRFGTMPEILSRETNLAWLDDNGQKPKKTNCHGYRQGTWGAEFKLIMKEFKEATKEVGRYHIDWGWKGTHSGHIITCERLQDGNLRVYDPQNGKIIGNLEEYLKDMSLNRGLAVLRVDTLHINIPVVKEVLEKQKPKRNKQ